MAVSNRDRLPGEAGGEPREAWGGRQGRPTAPAIQILSPMVGERTTFARRTDQIVKEMGELRLHSGKGLDERGIINSSPNLCPPREEKLQNKECPGLRSTRYPHLTLSNYQPD